MADHYSPSGTPGFIFARIKNGKSGTIGLLLEDQALSS
jgi:hypothetical protein